MPERRRLPVIQSPPQPPRAPAQASETGVSDASPDGSEARPPWHWVGFGTIATFATWLPLAYVAEAVRHRAFVARFGSLATREQVEAAFATMGELDRARWTATQTLPHLVAFALGAFTGGLLIGRFGPGTGSREAAWSGVVTALVAVAVSYRVVAEGGLGALVALVAPLAIAVVFAAWGGRVGAKRPRRE